MKEHTTTFPIDVNGLADTNRKLVERDGLPSVMHRFEAPQLHAINAAIAAGRPLLIRGEPGTGKSQLARAAAQLLNRRFRWKVVDAHTEVTDLFYTFDAVARLAYAQIIGALGRVCDEKDKPATTTRTVKSLLEELAERHFVRPGPLWWAYHEESARKQGERYRKRCGAEAASEAASSEEKSDERRGWVVLLDEIDKADPSVPNGLLEALGQGTFDVPGGRSISLAKGAEPPLVVITTNEERELPAAFVRRCMVLKIALPKADTELGTWLIRRGRTHFGRGIDALLEEAAGLLIADRKVADRLGLPMPGQAEFLDLVRAVTELSEDPKERETILRQIANLALKKHPDHPDPPDKAGGSSR